MKKNLLVLLLVPAFITAADQGSESSDISAQTNLSRLSVRNNAPQRRNMTREEIAQKNAAMLAKIEEQREKQKNHLRCFFMPVALLLW